MSRLLVLVGAQVAGILAADRGLVAAVDALVLGGVCLALALLTRGSWVRPLLIALAVACSGALHLGHALESARRERPAQPMVRSVEGRVVEVRRSPWRTRLTLHGVVAVDPERGSSPGRLLVYADTGAPSALHDVVRGDRVRLRGTLKRLGGRRNPGGSSLERDAHRRGLATTLRPAHPSLAVLVAGGGFRPVAWLWRLRRDTARRLADLGPGGGLLAALALGERGRLGAGERDAFARLGLAHLLAVSGLHLALGAGLAYAFARRGLGRSAFLAARWDTRKLALGLALAAAAGQALLAGAGLPVRRAWLLLGALVVEVAWVRPSRRGGALLAAAGGILAIEPAALFATGAQLSFAATAALVLAPRDGLEGAAPGGIMRASATAMLGTAALAASGLGVAAPVALPANFVAVPVVGFVLLPAALSSALLLAVAPDAAWALAAVGPVERLAAGALEAGLWLAERAPAGRGTAPATWALLVAAGLSLFGLARRDTLSRVALAALVGAWLGQAPPPGVVPAPPRVVFLDVGQGDAVLIQGTSGAVLVDSGRTFPGGDRGRDVVVPALRALGVRRLDALILTHADLDHRGGAPAVLRAVPVAAVWLPFGGRGDARFAAVRQAARGAGAAVEERGRGSPLTHFGDLRVATLWPPRDGPWRGNDASLVLRIDAVGGRVLLPGDVSAAAEAQLLADRAGLRAELLLLPHHGSRSSSSAALLAAVEGVVAVVSAPCHGRFPMPHPAVAARARAAGYALWWTGRDGAVVAALGKRPWIRPWGPPRCAWPEPPGP